MTGGGIVGKFGEDILFKQGLSATLFNLFEPPEIMKQVAEWRGMSEEESYRTFNCGNGMLVVLDAYKVNDFVEMAKDYGINAKRCGRITERGDNPVLCITSGFSGNTLKYRPSE